MLHDRAHRVLEQLVKRVIQVNWTQKDELVHRARSTPAAAIFRRGVRQIPGMYATVQDSSPLIVTSGARPYVSLHTCMLEVIHLYAIMRAGWILSTAEGCAPVCTFQLHNGQLC